MSEFVILAALAAEEGVWTRCPLFERATQAVPGEGPRGARVMLVGERPGDPEDLSGRPSVGPAGRLLGPSRSISCAESSPISTAGRSSSPPFTRLFCCACAKKRISGEEWARAGEI
jgi:hypothetical protein